MQNHHNLIHPNLKSVKFPDKQPSTIRCSSWVHSLGCGYLNQLLTNQIKMQIYEIIRLRSYTPLEDKYCGADGTAEILRRFMFFLRVFAVSALEYFQPNDLAGSWSPYKACKLQGYSRSPGYIL